MSSCDETLQKEAKLGDFKQEQKAKASIDTDNISLAVENITPNETSSPNVINFDQEIVKEQLAKVSSTEGHQAVKSKEDTALEAIESSSRMQNPVIPVLAVPSIAL